MKIKKLTIYSDDIKEQLKFYRDELNFEVRNYSEKSFELVLGYSILRFEYKENATPYHIAFHIPDCQEKEALAWVEGKMAALPFNREKIIDFSNWQAMSVYFYDCDKNIMEFISRREFSKPESAIFNPSNIVGIAEIGLVTDNVKEKFEQLNLECDLHKFDGDYERFCAIGEPSGLIITINNHLKDWFPTNDEAYMSPFKLEFEHKEQNFHLSFTNNQLEISKN
ncbi:VOC family protein [Gramella jeungdoensis]|uniref:VOC family protein n=1 Tax=Gramella jeungdoensis TaxID=708091 RepID=A0ABT0Z674_9FLAO|nr:VOC family protein [Gramella jeungdoensis]MCM8570657.1 VOC family protein [Gramella jeungdoensis]